jgi:hypothetical protein
MLIRRCRQPNSRGFAMVEFQIVALLGLFPLFLGALQVVLLLMASHVLQYATFEAARVGARHRAGPSVMRRALAIGLLPLHATTAEDVTAQNALTVATAAYARATAATLAFGEITIINPTAEAFADFATDSAGARVIRNDSLEHRPVSAGARSGQSIQEANLLRIRARYCHPLQVPFIGQLLVGVLRQFESDARTLACYTAGRLPLVAEAAVNMQSDVRFHGN